MKYSPGQVVRYKSTLRSFTLMNGLYLIFKVEKDIIHITPMHEEENYEPSKYEDGKYMDTCISPDSPMLTSTKLTYPLDRSISAPIRRRMTDHVWTWLLIMCTLTFIILIMISAFAPLETLGSRLVLDTAWVLWVIALGGCLYEGTKPSQS